MYIFHHHTRNAGPNFVQALQHTLGVSEACFMPPMPLGLILSEAKPGPKQLLDLYTYNFKY